MKIVGDPSGGVYFGSYDFFGGFDLMEQALGRRLTLIDTPFVRSTELVLDSNGQVIDEVHARPFVDMTVLAAQQKAGLISFQGIEPWPSACTGSPAAFTVDGLINGKVDTELRAIARTIAQSGWPTFWVYQREPQIQWPGFGADGQSCRFGCDTTLPGFHFCAATGTDPPENFTQYGDPTKLDGIERYIDFHRHIHDVIENEIASMGLPSNITWVQGAGLEEDLPVLGTYSDFYVGNAYVDWHAFNFYAGLGDMGCQSFPGLLSIDAALSLAPNKPIMLLEFGVLRSSGGFPVCGDRSQYLSTFFDQLATSYPQIKAILYFDWQDEPFNVRIEPGDPAAQTWVTEIGNRPERWPQCVTLSGGDQVCPADVKQVPALSAWGMAVTSTLVVAAGTVVLSNRKRTSADRSSQGR